MKVRLKFHRQMYGLVFSC